VRTRRFTRRAPIPNGEPVKKGIKHAGLVKIGGVDLPPQHAAFLSKYLERFNGAEAARSMGGSAVNYAKTAASEILTLPNVRQALRGALEERHRNAEHRVDDVARYWWSIATADARELSQHVYLPCRHCWGDEHRHQETSVEYNDRFVRYEAEQARRDELSQDKRDALDPLPEFERAYPVTDRRWVCREFGGVGYTTNRYPMRGPDWVEKVVRVFSDIGRPLPEGLEANSDHSCPACHGDGVATPWMADTRHLSREAALIFSGVRVTNQGIEIKTLDRAAAMEKYETLMGMAGPHRIELSGPGGASIDVRVQRIESRVVDADYTDITGEVVSMPTPSETVQLPAPAAIKTRVA
jgi:phage terminase small subunit